MKNQKLDPLAKDNLYPENPIISQNIFFYPSRGWAMFCFVVFSTRSMMVNSHKLWLAANICHYSRSAIDGAQYNPAKKLTKSPEKCCLLNFDVFQEFQGCFAHLILKALMNQRCKINSYTVFIRIYRGGIEKTIPRL